MPRIRESTPKIAASKTAETEPAWVQRQIRQATPGLIESITCPYCSSNVILGAENLCCEPISQATVTVLYGVKFQDLCRIVGLAA